MDQDTPETDVAALVDAVRQDPARRDELVELLPERISLYAGRSANAVVRLRGYLLAAFEAAGLPAAAVPYVLDELQNGRDAYLVAAAAMALRGLDQPTGDVVPYLLNAIDNIVQVDDAVTFDTYRPQWPAPAATTATTEILKTFAWLGDEARSAAPALEALAEDPDALSPAARATLRAVLADLGGGHACCHHASPASIPVEAVHHAEEGRSDTSVPHDVPLEDQAGRRLSSGDFLIGKPSVVAFFYTRCDNPNKCSLTIAKLAEVQRGLRAEGLEGRIRTAAITYDPAFDLPSRLLAYGENRGACFTDDDRFLRVTSGFERLQEFFGLGVNYGPTLVNRHRIELFVLDRDGRVARTFARLQWDVGEVVRQAGAAVGTSAAPQH